MAFWDTAVRYLVSAESFLEFSATNFRIVVSACGYRFVADVGQIVEMGENNGEYPLPLAALKTGRKDTNKAAVAGRDDGGSRRVLRSMFVLTCSPEKTTPEAQNSKC